MVLTILSSFLTSGCTPHPEVKNDDKPDKISFLQNELTLFVGEEMTVPLMYQKFDRGVYVNAEYDYSANPCGLSYVSGLPEVVSVSEKGVMKGLTEGTSVITLKSTTVAVLDQMTVKVEKAQGGGQESSFNQNLTQPLTKDMIVVPHGLQGSTLQGFDIDKRGVYYMSWESNNAMVVRSMTSDGSAIGADMTLPSGGHGDGFSIEYNTDGGIYFWTSGTLADHDDNGGYSGGKANGSDIRLICRHKFAAGVTQYAEDAVECFYLNNNGCRIIDVDTEHDVMLCWTYEGGDYLYVYKFSDIRKASKKTFKVTRAHNQGASVEAYDLNTVTPIGRFAWQRKGVTTGSTNSGAVQGLCVYDDKIYVISGAKNDEAALMSVLDFKGNILQKLVKVGVSVNKQQLINLGVSADGTFEPEGVHIHNGQMYLGFVGDFPNTGTTKRSCIIRLK